VTRSEEAAGGGREGSRKYVLALAKICLFLRTVSLYDFFLHFTSVFMPVDKRRDFDGTEAWNRAFSHVHASKLLKSLSRLAPPGRQSTPESMLGNGYDYRIESQAVKYVQGFIDACIRICVLSLISRDYRAWKDCKKLVWDESLQTVGTYVST
jgi:hypothetical protein